MSVFFRRNFPVILGLFFCASAILLIVFTSFAVDKPPGTIISVGAIKIMQSNAKLSVLAFGFSALALFGVGSIFIYEKIRSHNEIIKSLNSGLEKLSKRK